MGKHVIFGTVAIVAGLAIGIGFITVPLVAYESFRGLQWWASRG